MFNLFKKNNTTKDLAKPQHKNKLGSGLKNLFSLNKKIDEELFDELEMLLISSDIGIDTSEKIIKNVRKNASRKQLASSEELYELIKNELKALLIVDNKLVIDSHKPFVMLVVGVNGAGKTTTIGKLTHKFKNAGKTVMLGAGDTFRAAAIEQLKVWGCRNNIPVVAGKQGGDSAAILFDALSSAKAKNIDVLIADTSGRLHTQDNLMAELSKIKRVLSKNDENTPHEVLLIIDGTSGQNAIKQAIEFNKAVNLTGIVITKLDGTAKGGVVFGLSAELGLPIRYIGTGEGLDNLIEFEPLEFVESIFANN
jgi:fused signal recognition particle receptor